MQKMQQDRSLVPFHQRMLTNVDQTESKMRSNSSSRARQAFFSQLNSHVHITILCQIARACKKLTQCYSDPSPFNAACTCSRIIIWIQHASEHASTCFSIHVKKMDMRSTCRCSHLHIHGIGTFHMCTYTESWLCRIA